MKTFRASNSMRTYPLKIKLRDKQRPWISPHKWAVAGETRNSAKDFQRICEQLIDSYEMNLTKTIQGGEMKIHVIIRGEFRIEESNAAKEEEMSLV